jgi:DNA-binding response OmpR family regulator
MGRLVVVEDDEAIAEPLVRALEREGHAVRRASSAEACLGLLAEDGADLVLLDLGLPGMNGVELCRELRRGWPSIAVLMLTARSSELDEVLGLEAGADDYVTKPFSLAVLNARVRALLRRDVPAVLDVGGIRVDEAARRAWRNDGELDLAPKEFDLLALLIRHAGVVVRREEIMRAVWDEHWWGSTKTLDVHVGWLRRKLGPPSVLTTVRGVGFRFDDPGGPGTGG